MTGCSFLDGGTNASDFFFLQRGFFHLHSDDKDKRKGRKKEEGRKRFKKN